MERQEAVPRLGRHRVPRGGRVARALVLAGTISMLSGGLLLPVERALAAPARLVVASFPSSTDAETQLFDLLNAERSSRSLTLFARTVVLNLAAQAWSTFMAGGGCVPLESRRLCHRRDLPAVADAAAPNSWTRVGENVGLVPNGGTIESLHSAFVASRSHLANIVQADFNAVGIGVAYDSEQTLFVTYEFVAIVGRPGAPGANPPPLALPAPPPGSSPTGSFLFWINDARQRQNLPPLASNAVLDREAQVWSTAMANGTCSRKRVVCHRTDLAAVARAAVGSGNARRSSESVGYLHAANLELQFVTFMSQSADRANVMRPDTNLVGIGVATDSAGRTFTTLEFVSAKKANTSPPGGSPCGWVQSTLRRGMSGPSVRVLQCALTGAGTYVGPMDGKYTTNVVAAVRAFQTAMKIRATGIVDLKTRRALGLT